MPVQPKPLLKNPFFYWGGFFLIGLFLGLYYLVDRVMMPNITRQNETISVPDVRGMPLPDALTEIEAASLVLGDTTSRIGLKNQQGLIATQNPRPNSSVKLGRRVYLSVYRGSEPDVRIPDVTEQSLRNARLSLSATGLVVRRIEPDTIPSPVPQMVTRIYPPAGTLVPRGDSVIVYYGLGLMSSRLVAVPNVIGLDYMTADSILRFHSFWPTLLDQNSADHNPKILRQSPMYGESLPAGSTLRLFATADSLEVDP